MDSTTMWAVAENEQFGKHEEGLRKGRNTIFDMTLEKFRHSLNDAEPPRGITLAMAGLWWDAKGDWNRAHESAQQDEGPEGSWVHAYLHRKEGDSGNAAYWYRRAGQPVCREPFEQEWEKIVKNLLK